MDIFGIGAWDFDAMRKGDGKYKGHPQAERDAYKMSVRMIFPEIIKLRKAIHDIAPWLSASLNEKSCKEYQKACDQIFKISKEEIK